MSFGLEARKFACATCHGWDCLTCSTMASAQGTGRPRHAPSSGQVGDHQANAQHPHYHSNQHQTQQRNGAAMLLGSEESPEFQGQSHFRLTSGIRYLRTCNYSNRSLVPIVALTLATTYFAARKLITKRSGFVPRDAWHLSISTFRRNPLASGNSQCCHRSHHTGTTSQTSISTAAAC